MNEIMMESVDMLYEIDCSLNGLQINELVIVALLSFIALMVITLIRK